MRPLATIRCRSLLKHDSAHRQCDTVTLQFLAHRGRFGQERRCLRYGRSDGGLDLVVLVDQRRTRLLPDRHDVAFECCQAAKHIRRIGCTAAAPTATPTTAATTAPSTLSGLHTE